MNASLPIDMGEAILWFHVVVIAFNVFGLVAIPLGAWSGWKFVRVFWWRALHLGLLGIVALQAVLGRNRKQLSVPNDRPALGRMNGRGPLPPLKKRPLTLRIFGRLPVTGARACTEAG